jgi:hypothetical protein
MVQVATDKQGKFKPDVGLKMTASAVGKGVRRLDRRQISYGVLDPAAFATNGGPSIAEMMQADGEGATFRRPTMRASRRAARWAAGTRSAAA